MPHPQRAEVGLIAAIIATIQLILIASVAHEFQMRPRAPDSALAVSEPDYAAATMAGGR